MQKKATNETTTIELTTPITMGNKDIQTIELRKPMAGELRGLKLYDLVTMDVDAMATLLPRISTPSLTKAQIYMLDTSDLLKLATGMTGFFTQETTLTV